MLIHVVIVGGIAGGSKYVKDNIFFKFAKDTEDGMYGGNEWAMKVTITPTLKSNLEELSSFSMITFAILKYSHRLQAMS